MADDHGKGDGKASDGSLLATALRKLNTRTGSAKGGRIPGTIRQIHGSNLPPTVDAGKHVRASKDLAARITGGGADSFRPEAPAVSMPPKPSEASGGGGGGASAPVEAGSGVSAVAEESKAATAPTGPSCAGAEGKISAARLAKFETMLDADTIDLEALRELCWRGIPARLRYRIWPILLGYTSANKSRRATNLSRKRAEYKACVATHFGVAADSARPESEQDVLRDVLVDVPRTAPNIKLIHTDFVQRSLERVLFVYAIRHPASGYVQGINDLVTPLYAVFLSQHEGITLDSTDLKGVSAEALQEVEADVYWSLTRLLSGIQDHYTPSQPGIQKRLFYLRELMLRIDEPLVKHIEPDPKRGREGLKFNQFAFKWVNCLLLRELPFKLTFRMWDTCMCEPDGFKVFHVYVCAALLAKFSPTIRKSPYEDMIMFIQKLPTQKWEYSDVDELLSQAFVYKTLYESSLAHLVW